MVSPTNNSGTSISALTFDESIFNAWHNSNTRRPEAFFHHDVRERSQCYMFRDTYKKPCIHRDQNIQPFAKGTLLGRIMQQLNQHNSTKKEEVSETFRNHLVTNDPVPRSNEYNQSQSSGIRKSINDNTLDDLDSNMVDTLSIPEVSLSSCETSMDEWREVEDKSSGKTYYYNRRTRQSTWIFPLNATVTRRKERKGLSIDKLTLKETSFNSSNDVSMETDNRANSKHSSSFHAESQYTESLNRITSESNMTSNERHQEYSVTKINNEDDSEYENPSSKLNTFFCIYCGSKVHSISSLTSHFNLCQERFVSEYKYPNIGRTVANALMYSGLRNRDSLNHRGGQSEDKKIKTKFSLTQAVEERPLQFKPGPHGESSSFIHESVKTEDNKENLITTAIDNSLDHLNMLSLDVSSNVIRSSDRKRNNIDECSASPQTFERSSVDLSNSLVESDHSYDEEEFFRDIYCSCPFCRRPFKTGNKLSQHLLSCKERRNSSRKRRSGYPRKDGLRHMDAEDYRKLSGQSLQTALITDGGRPLPGYPKLSRSPLQNN